MHFTVPRELETDLWRRRNADVAVPSVLQHRASATSDRWFAITTTSVCPSAAGSSRTIAGKPVAVRRNSGCKLGGAAAGARDDGISDGMGDGRLSKSGEGGRSADEADLLTDCGRKRDCGGVECDIRRSTGVDLAAVFIPDPVHGYVSGVVDSLRIGGGAGGGSIILEERVPSKAERLAGSSSLSPVAKYAR